MSPVLSCSSVLKVPKLFFHDVAVVAVSERSPPVAGVLTVGPLHLAELWIASVRRCYPFAPLHHAGAGAFLCERLRADGDADSRNGEDD